MADRYRWSDANIMALRDATQAAHDALRDASLLVNTLTIEMEADGTWGADHKRAFIAWMDLLRQYHTAMADDGVGAAMVTALDSFNARLATYFTDSDLQASLRLIP